MLLSAMYQRAGYITQGGGVKGINLVGRSIRCARSVTDIQRVAGTSAGAIVASLIAAGRTTGVGVMANDAAPTGSAWVVGTPAR
jgi:predicted acylesterase/phospholipase RssA